MTTKSPGRLSPAQRFARSVAACMLATACGESPVSPDPRVPPTTGPPTALSIANWRFGSSVTTARADAKWGYLYAAYRNVTMEATWDSSAPDVARVRAPGEIVSVSPGSAEIRVTFRGISATNRVRVFPGESPLLVLDAPSSYVSGAVRDATRPFPSNGIDGALVEIVAGHNEGRTAVSGNGGYYEFAAPFVCGPVTARATKAGYRPITASSFMCIDGMPALTLQPE